MRNTERSWEPEDEDDYEAANAELKRGFAIWRMEQGLAVDAEAPEPPLHYKWHYLDGHLTRWRRQDLSELYLDHYPAKVMVDPGELGEVMQEAKTFVRFLADTGLLDPDSEAPEVLLEHLERLEGPFRANMADSSRYSVGKRLWTQARAEGVSLDDQGSVDAFIARFNARPRRDRDAVFGGIHPARPPASGRFTPPGTRPRPSSSKRRKRRR